MSPAVAPSQPLHLLRALLRQCTYLPDSAARTYVSRRVLARFRTYALPFAGRRALNETPPAYIPPARVKAALVQARRTHSLLVRANQGALKPVLKVLSATYGRTGKRRHELITPVMQLDVPFDAEEVERLAAREKLAYHELVDLTKWPAVSSQLAALTRSQKKQVFPPSIDTNMKMTEPDIPEENIWGRPLPKSRERNLRFKQFGILLSKTLPPLPEREWLRLRELVAGRTKEAVPPRRSRPVESSDESFLTADVLSGRLERHSTVAAAMRSAKKNDQPHRITPRYMRRLWGLVFAQCPIMRKRANSDFVQEPEAIWEVEWGQTYGETRSLNPAAPEVSKLMFGLGVLDEHGRKPTVKGRKRTSADWTEPAEAVPQMVIS